MTFVYIVKAVCFMGVETKQTCVFNSVTTGSLSLSLSVSVSVSVCLSVSLSNAGTVSKRMDTSSHCYTTR